MTAQSASSVPDWSARRLQQVEQALQYWVAEPDADADAGVVQLLHAMRYAVLDGGKRLRPLLVWAALEAVPDAPAYASAAALRSACAVELIHAYSLVHDDLPCMDNDVLRRGKPTVHVQFGQACALLAGDALQALAFELLTPQDDAVPPATQARLCALLARAAGSAGMAGGQAIDLHSVGQTLSEQRLRGMHERKTGALLHASVLMGAVSGGADAALLQALDTYARNLGLAFQVVDDILDVTADAATLGKTAGKDALQHKPTYVSVLGLEASRSYAHALLAASLQALQYGGLGDTAPLQALAHRVVHRAS